jgi:hypothetical protein
MPVLHLTPKDETILLPSAPGLPVRELLDITDIKVPSSWGNPQAPAGMRAKSRGLPRDRESASSGAADQLSKALLEQVVPGLFSTGKQGRLLKVNRGGCGR